MCFYHVKANIIKHRDLIIKSCFDELMDNVNDLHMSATGSDYTLILNDFEDNYLNAHTYSKCSNNSQWFKSVSKRSWVL